MCPKFRNFSLSVALFATVLAGVPNDLLAQEAPPAAPKFNVNQETHASRTFGSDSARVDSQITLRIPPAQAEDVYKYLVSKYVGKDRILADKFPGSRISGQPVSDISVFTDAYYDTPALVLYHTKNSVRHRSRINTTDPLERKSGRQLVQMKLTPNGVFTLRSELKYNVKDRADKKSLDRQETHPLVRLIEPEQRKDFKKTFTDAGIEPSHLEHVFTITQTRRRGYLRLDDKGFFSFSVDTGTAGILWAKGSFASVDLGLVEIAYTEASEEQRKKMWAIRDAIIEDLQRQFPALVQNSDSKYTIVLAQVLDKIPFVPTIMRLGLTASWTQIGVQFVFLFALSLFVYVIFQFVRSLRRRHERPDHFVPGSTSVAGGLGDERSTTA
jgi:hypothetical protein